MGSKIPDELSFFRDLSLWRQAGVFQGLVHLANSPVCMFGIMNPVLVGSLALACHNAYLVFTRIRMQIVKEKLFSV